MKIASIIRATDEDLIKRAKELHYAIMVLDANISDDEWDEFSLIMDELESRGYRSHLELCFEKEEINGNT